MDFEQPDFDENNPEETMPDAPKGRVDNIVIQRYGVAVEIEYGFSTAERYESEHGEYVLYDDFVEYLKKIKAV